MDESSSSDNPNSAQVVALPSGSPSTEPLTESLAESPLELFAEPLAKPFAGPFAEPSWERLSLALNRLESAILAKNNGVQKNNNEEQAAKLQRSRQETLEARRERDSLQKVVEATLGDIRALLK